MDEEYVEAVLDVVDAVPPGRATTYGTVARLVADRLGRGGPRQVGAVLALTGAAVPWWRVVAADGRVPARHAADAVARLRAEGCPLRPGTDAVDLRRAAWPDRDVRAARSGPSGPRAGS